MHGTALALTYGAIPLVSAVAGGVIAAFAEPPATARSAVQHVAAGVVFAAAALELLPSLHGAPLGAAVAGFCAGIAMMYLLRLWTDRLERAQPSGASTGLIAAAAADTFVDGIILGASFASGSAHQGPLIALALSSEMLFVGLSAASAGVTNKRRPIFVSTGLGIALLCGDAAGFFALRSAPRPLIDAIFAFGAVVFMYLVTEELLTQAHRAGERAWLPPLFFGGFLGYLILQTAFR